MTRWGTAARRCEGRFRKEGSKFNKHDELTCWDNSIPAEDFLDERVQIWQVVPIRKARKSIGADDTVDLALCFPRHLWVFRHGQKECVKRGYSLGVRVSEEDVDRVILNVDLQCQQPL